MDVWRYGSASSGVANSLFRLTKQLLFIIGVITLVFFGDWIKCVGYQSNGSVLHIYF